MAQEMFDQMKSVRIVFHVKPEILKEEIEKLSKVDYSGPLAEGLAKLKAYKDSAEDPLETLDPMTYLIKEDSLLAARTIVRELMTINPAILPIIESGKVQIPASLKESVQVWLLATWGPRVKKQPDLSKIVTLAVTQNKKKIADALQRGVALSLPLFSDRQIPFLSPSSSSPGTVLETPEPQQKKRGRPPKKHVPEESLEKKPKALLLTPMEHEMVKQAEQDQKPVTDLEQAMQDLDEEDECFLSENPELKV